MFRGLARDAENLRGADLGRLIEDWAVGCHLAERPAKEWWIFAHVARWLGNLAGDPPSLMIEYAEGRIDSDDDPDEELRQELRQAYYSYASVGRFVKLPEELPFRLYAYDPAADTFDTYEAEARKSFEAYLQGYIARQPKGIPETRVLERYEWLVRYQLLLEEFVDIADNAASRPSELTVKKAVLNLRNLVILPRRKSGRRLKTVELQ
jgi:hypothetical protein